MKRAHAVGLMLFTASGSVACAGSTETLRSTSALGGFGIQGLEDRLLVEGSVRNEKVDHYAVLLGAHTELRHLGNLSLAYQVLIEQGYQREHIYILESEGDATYFPTTDVASRATVARLFDHLRKVVEPQDTLLIYVTGHGRRVNATSETRGKTQALGVSTIVLNRDEELADWELGAMLEGIAPSVGIAFFDQCYGAIFATAMRSCNFVSITTAAEDETSYGVSFPRAFWSAFRLPSAKERPPTVLDAYRYATQEDSGTLRGYNAPQITHELKCVDPSKLSLLGLRAEESTVISSNERRGSSALLDQVP